MNGKALTLSAVLALGLATTTSAQDSSSTDFYSVDLETGELTSVGTIGSDESVIGIALVAPSDTVGDAFAVTDDDELLAFDVASPGDITNEVEIGGLNDDESVLGIDFRPATGDLIAITDQSVLYSVDTDSGEATALGESFDPELEGDDLGFDFNPTVDRIRVDVSTTQNLRLNPETGQVGVNPDTDEPTIDGNTAFADGDENADATPQVVGAAYTNNEDGAEETTLYVVDAETDALAIQNPPNDGTLNTVATLDVEITDGTSFDIAPSGEAFLSVPVDGDSAATPVVEPGDDDDDVDDQDDGDNEDGDDGDDDDAAATPVS